MQRSAGVAIVGGLLFGFGLGGLVSEAITRLNGQSAGGFTSFGSVLGLGVALMVIASWPSKRGPSE